MYACIQILEKIHYHILKKKNLYFLNNFSKNIINFFKEKLNNESNIFILI